MSPHNCKQNDAICSFQVFNALSYATDIFERNKAGHAKRVAYTSLKIAHQLNLPLADRNRLFRGAILHDVGIGFAINEAYQENRDYNETEHAQNGSTIVEDFFHDQAITEAVRYHHENYDGSGYMGLRGAEIPLFAQIINLASYFDTIYERKATYSEARKDNQAAIFKQGGYLFDPKLVEAFIAMSLAEGFWLDYRHENFDTLLERIVEYDQTKMSLDDFQTVALIFAKMIDDKSKFTKDHSTNIGRYMVETAKMKGFDEETQKKAYIAGLLHDIGKVSVPSSILDKPGPLTLEERNHIKVHPYYTGLILDQIPNIEEISRWASSHHEFINGTGYPERLRGEELDYFSRLITVCDVYEALTEDRPYRKAMTYSDAWDALYQMRDEQTLCPSACSDLKKVTDRLIPTADSKVSS